MTDAHSAPPASAPSVNTLVRPRVARLLADAETLELRVRRDAAGVCIVDAGIEARGSVAAGLLIGEICMGGLGDVSLRGGGVDGWPTWIDVLSSQPVLASLPATRSAA